MNEKIKILAIGGSLRKGSYSKVLLDSVVGLAPENVEIEVYNNLAAIPIFNQDLEDDLPESVKDLKSRIKAADALLFVTPEYNHSLPGYIKNSIDWASVPYISNSFDNKPAAIISSSDGMLGGVRAQYVLRQVGVSLNIHFLNRPQVMVAMVQDKLIEGKLVDVPTIEKIQKLIAALVDWTKRLQS